MSILCRSMRRGYCVQENDKEILAPIIEGIILQLEIGDIAGSQY